ncbi:K02A2.6-like [Cordylochernes scorpioides]|uniref:K02A2.6-like n=1 Tax=Cordylochernes scorpioides TaxID=51811 RepID=A0ABY6L9D8_9ARAC|nr:K02A2.6-like [Cordylochernes scorpioides]
MGIKSIYNRLKSKYFWPSIFKTVEKYVSSLPQGLFQPISPASRPFEKMGIDLMGRFPKSGRENSWILVCTDYYSRYIETAALPRGTVEEIADFFLQKVLLRHGTPKTIISDRGSCFVSNLFKCVLKICITLHKKTTSYHPQTNGQTERMNHAKEISTSKTIARQNKSKQIYDRAHREVKYAINDLVLIWTLIRKVGGAEKLPRRYVDRLRQKSPVNYEVMEIAEGKRKKIQIVHLTRMIPYRLSRLEDKYFSRGGVMLELIKTGFKNLVPSGIMLEQDKDKGLTKIQSVSRRISKEPMRDDHESKFIQ